VIAARDARGLFPGAAEATYLDTANFGLVAAPVARAVASMMKGLQHPPAVDASTRYMELESASGRARRAIAALVGADESEIALVESTSHGLQLAAASIPLDPGDEVVCASWDFPGIRLAWHHRAEREGLHIREVDLGTASDPTNALADALTDSTRVVCTSSVTEAVGVRLDLCALADACRRRGTWLIVDATQHAGVADLDLHDTGVDIAAAGGHKWLGCPLGTGFLYVRSDRRRLLRAPHLGYLGLEEPAQGWEGWLSSPTPGAITTLAPRSTAQSLEIGGTPNFAGRVAAAHAWELLSDIGSRGIAAHVTDLTATLIDGLLALGLPVYTPTRIEHRAGIVCFGWSDAQRERTLVADLRTRDIFVSQRYNAGVGGIRISVHVYNDRGDVEHLLDALRPHAAS